MRLLSTIAILCLVLGSSPALSTAQPVPVWIDVEGAEGARLRGAVFRPQGQGSFPLVLWLHGVGGLTDNSLNWASDIATAGYVVMAGCYFGKGEGRVADRDPCPDAHPFNGEKQYAVRNVLALIAAGKNLAGVRRDRLGLTGYSWGGNVAVLTATVSREVQAVVSFAGALNLGASRNEGSAVQSVDGLNAPLLIVHGNADTVVSPEVSRQYEALARALRKDVQAHYIPNADHGFLVDTRFRADIYRLTIEFLNKHLR